MPRMNLLVNTKRYEIDGAPERRPLSGGSFGRRAQWGYAAEAWQVACEVKKPVQLLWTREDDIQHDFYPEYSYHRLSEASTNKERLWRGPTVWFLRPCVQY
jgi:CO/xanthine dehydrogenase Mo-binding subunit